MAVIGHLHTPAAFYPGKEAQYAFNRRLEGPERRSGRFWRREKSLTLAGKGTTVSWFPTP